MANTYKLINPEVVGSGSGDAETFTQTFNNTTSWAGPSGGSYTFTVLASAHGKNTEPLVQVYELNGSDYEQVDVEVIINTSGDVTIRVTETVDTRFVGKVVIL